MSAELGVAFLPDAFKAFRSTLSREVTATEFSALTAALVAMGPYIAGLVSDAEERGRGDMEFIERKAREDERAKVVGVVVAAAKAYAGAQ